ncbi:MAG: 23S rRNA (guanosine(2251)-2'-O)-methyltransferase RlmB [Nitrospira sp.]|nr:23S rRNA (guanosine(2251)-2'-O)-methyltransferase RlmB [Nitrospira sp.]
MLYGLHALREALRAGTRPLLKLLVIRRDKQFAELVALARAAGVPVQIEPRQALDRLVPDGRHQGVVGLVAAKTYSEPEEILDYANRRNEPPFVLVLDGVEDPHNLGAILRTAEAAGVHGVFIPERRSVGLTGTVAKVSAGALDHLLVGRVSNISRLIEWLQTKGLWVYGLAPQAPKSYTALDLRGAVALVLGGEGRGIRPGVLEKCDDRVAIPMRGNVDSLNVAAAAAVVLFEVVRQRLG